MRIAHLLHHAFHKEDHDFIVELYRQLLAREPDEHEVSLHLNSLWEGASRNDLILAFLTSEEAKGLYLDPARRGMPLAAGKLNQLLALSHEELVRGLFVELLCQEPDPAGFENHLNGLRNGADPFDIIAGFLHSSEWHDLLHCDRNAISRKILAHLLQNR